MTNDKLLYPTTDRLTVCLCLSHARTPDFAVMAAAAGFDAVYMDLQHSVMPLDVMSALAISAAGAGILPMARVARLDEAEISRILDGGVRGIIVPYVSTIEDAQRVVNICRFAPLGKRGVVGPNPSTFYRPASIIEASRQTDEATFVTVMLESAQAIANSDAIAAIDGIDMLLIGAFDLTTDLGILGQFNHSLFRDAIETASESCSRHGKVLGLAGVSETERLAEFVAAGVRFISGGTDAGLFMGAASKRAADLGALASRLPSES